MNAPWRTRRLRRRADFLRIQGSARRVSGPHFVFLLAAQPLRLGAPVTTSHVRVACPARLGMVVTTKVGNAVARNRIKRVCRECFREWPDLLPDGVDLVVIARNGAQALGLAEVRAEWSRLHPQLRKRSEEALANPREKPHLSATSRRASAAPAKPPPENRAKQQKH